MKKETMAKKKEYSRAGMFPSGSCSLDFRDRWWGLGLCSLYFASSVVGILSSCDQKYCKGIFFHL